jgi:hypothetical protein
MSETASLIESGASSQNAVLGDVGRIAIGALGKSLPRLPRSLSDQPTATASGAPVPAKRWLMPEPSRLALPIVL